MRSREPKKLSVKLIIVKLSARLNLIHPKKFIERAKNPKSSSWRTLLMEMVLLLMNFSGLPATIDVLDMIEYNRERTWFENALPPISDEASFNMRRKLMEDQEVREWSKKED